MNAGRPMTPEQYQKREQAIARYEAWINRACARCEQGDVERPEPSTTSYMEKTRELESRRL